MVWCQDNEGYSPDRTGDNTEPGGGWWGRSW